jgi:hypothetical protein
VFAKMQHHAWAVLSQAHHSAPRRKDSDLQVHITLSSQKKKVHRKLKIRRSRRIKNVNAFHREAEDTHVRTSHTQQHKYNQPQDKTSTRDSTSLPSPFRSVVEMELQHVAHVHSSCLQASPHLPASSNDDKLLSRMEICRYRQQQELSRRKE